MVETLDWLADQLTADFDLSPIDDVPSWARAEMIWRDRADLPFQIDGAVIKIRYRSEQDDAGSTPYAPRWALAAKWMCC